MALPARTRRPRMPATAAALAVLLLCAACSKPNSSADSARFSGPGAASCSNWLNSVSPGISSSRDTCFNIDPDLRRILQQRFRVTV